MTDEQINAAIHDALGNPIGCPRCSDPGCSYNQGLNYCTDLNAMHEAEKTHRASGDWHEYIQILDTLSEVDPIYATARQRAEAFLRTLGLWKEVQP